MLRKSLFSFLFTFKKEIFAISLASLIVIVTVPVLTYAYFSRDLRSKEAIMNKKNTGLLLLDRTGTPFFSFYAAKDRRAVSIDDISLHVQHAIIASEDKDFYSHPGFSFKAMLRSVLQNMASRDIVSGGSTITQQLIKNSLLTSERSYKRKMQEVILSQEIERRYGKKEILEMYLNSVYFGEGAFGVADAARMYFSKNARDLTVAEASFLAAILPSPSRMSPYGEGFAEARKRQAYVLEVMRQQGYISQAEYATARKEALVFKKPEQELNTVAAHFAIMVRNELIEKYGEERISRSGFKVRTTLDRAKQEFAEAAVREHVARLAPNNVTNGAAVAIDPKTGEVIALVGSKNWYAEGFGKVNVATSLRPSGSAFKPVVYAAAFEKRIVTPQSMLRDTVTTFAGNYRPLDFDRKTRGRVTVRRALANSLNIPAVDVMDKVGLQDAMEMAQRLGISTIRDPSRYGLSLVLGAGEVKLVELTNAYATFANNGIRNEPALVLDIFDKTGNVVYRHVPRTQIAVEPEVAFLISSILSDTRTRREVFGTTLDMPFSAAVKTGTTEDFKDALTLGYTKDIAVGVWVGNNDNASMDSVAGSLGAAPIWKSLMTEYVDGKSATAFQPPAGVVALNYCGQRRGISRENQSSGEEYFIAGTQPSADCIRERPYVVRTAGRENTAPSPTATVTPQPDVASVPTIPPPPDTGGPEQLQLEERGRDGFPFDENMQEEIRKMQQEIGDEGGE